MKRALILIASALTLVGGHLLNRRWDHAVLFFLLLFGMLWFGAGVVFFNPQWGGFSARQILGGLLSLLWLIGLRVTIRDALHPDEAHRPAWSISGGISALILTVWSTFILGWGSAVLLGKFDPMEKVAVDEAPVEERKVHSSFTHFIYYGHVDDIMAERPEPPAGTAQLTGRIEYEGRPAEGVVLRLILNGQYRSAPLTTDANGRFHLALPMGRWQIDALLTEAWPGQPGEALIPLTGDELRIGEGAGFSWTPYRHSPHVVEVSTDGRARDALVLRFRNPVLFVWPERERQITGGDDQIRWRGYPGAQQYRVALHSLARRGQSATYTPLSAQAVNSAELSLAEFPSIPAPGERNEYAVTVTAFDGEGRPLSRTPEFYRNTFVLEDRRLIGDSETQAVGSATATLEEFEQLRANEKRLDAVRVLLDEDLPDAAEALLTKVESPTKPGRREALTAYLRAKQGRCEEARELAETAEASGKECLPDSFLEACGGPAN